MSFHVCKPKCTASCCTLLVLLLLASSRHTGCTAAHLTASVATDLAAHLGLQAAAEIQHSIDEVATWDGLLSIRHQLTGTGFHKTLELQLHPAAAAAASLQAVGACQLSLLQPLPSSVFADPYQLEDLTRHTASASVPGYSYSFKLLGTLDLELPAPACQDTALLLGLNTTLLQLQQQQQVQLQQRQQEQQVLVRILHVPLHAKYPQPYAAGYSSWHWSLTGHAAAEIPWPYLLVDCRQEGGSITLLSPPAASQQQPPQPRQQPQQQQNVLSSSSGGLLDSSSFPGFAASTGSSSGCGDLLWLVPAGNLDHQVLVSWGTLLVTAVCCAAVSWTAFTSSRGQGL